MGLGLEGFWGYLAVFSGEGHGVGVIGFRVLGFNLPIPHSQKLETKTPSHFTTYDLLK